MQGAPLTEADGSSPKSWPHRDAHRTLAKTPCTGKLQRRGWRLSLRPVPKDSGPPSLGTSYKAGLIQLSSSPALHFVHLSLLPVTQQGFLYPEKAKPIFLTTFPYNVCTCLRFFTPTCSQPSALGPLHPSSADADDSHQPYLLPPYCGQTLLPPVWLHQHPNLLAVPSLTPLPLPAFIAVPLTPSPPASLSPVQSCPCLVASVHPRVSPCSSCLLIVSSAWGFTSTSRTSLLLSGPCLQLTSAELQTCLLHSMPLSTSNATRSQLTHLRTCSPGFPTLANSQGFFYLGEQCPWLLGDWEGRDGVVGTMSGCQG